MITLRFLRIDQVVGVYPGKAFRPLFSNPKSPAPRIVGFDDRSPFAEALRADPAVAEVFQQEEDELDGSFFSFKPPFDEREPSFTGAILEVADTIGDHDYGFPGRRPAQIKHPAYDKLANIDGNPQPVPETPGPDFTTYTADNLPVRNIKEIDITTFAKKQGLYGFGYPEGEVPELIYTIKYFDQRQIRLAPDNILVNQEIQFANSRAIASIPRQLLQINIYEKVRYPLQYISNKLSRTNNNLPEITTLRNNQEDK